MKAVYDNNIIYLYKVPIVISLYFLFRMILIYLWMCLYNNWDLLLLWCSSTFSFLENAVCPRVFSVSSTMYLYNIPIWFRVRKIHSKTRIYQCLKLQGKWKMPILRYLEVPIHVKIAQWVKYPTAKNTVVLSRDTAGLNSEINQVFLLFPLIFIFNNSFKIILPHLFIILFITLIPF